MKVTLLASMVVGVLMAWTTPVFASCDLAGAAVTQQCSCSGTAGGAPWRNHGQYVACVQKALSAGRRSGEQGALCSQQLLRCAARSTCGRAGAVVCVQGGRCRIAGSAEKCTEKGGTVSAAESCCD